MGQNKKVDKLLNVTTIIEFDYMCKDRKVAHVIANSRKNLVIQDVYTDHFLDAPMPQDRKDMFTLMKFFEDRCFPRTRASCDELLKELAA